MRHKGLDDVLEILFFCAPMSILGFYRPLIAHYPDERHDNFSSFFSSFKKYSTLSDSPGFDWVAMFRNCRW